MASTSSSGGSGPGVGGGAGVGGGVHAHADSPSRHDDSEESGVGHEEEDEINQLLVELLSNIRTPRVIDLSSFSASVQWEGRKGKGFQWHYSSL